MIQELMTLSETARRLNISVATIHRLRNKGELPEPLRIGGRTFYPANIIELWLDDRIEAMETEATKAALAA